MSSEKITVVLFGATGAVGSNVLPHLLQSEAVDEVVAIGRRSITESQIEHVQFDDDKKKLREITVSNLMNLHENTSHPKLHNWKANACIIALGVADPQKDMSLHQWHEIEVVMVQHIATYCVEILGVQYISVLSTIDAEADPKPYQEEELLAHSASSLGWFQMIQNYFRIKGLEEQTLIKAAQEKVAAKNKDADDDENNRSDNGTTIYVNLFQSCTIITPYLRYGWVDRSLFAMHEFFLDAIMPYKYHSVPVEILGKAFAWDAIKHIVRKEEEEIKNEDQTSQNVQISRYTYQDFRNIVQSKTMEKDGYENTDEL